MTIQRPVPKPPAKRQSFRPSTRGSLSAIVETPAAFTDLAPESPRPAELLMGIRAEDGVTLSALDIACWEMILSWTYDIDPAMEARAYRIPTSALRRFLGEYVKSAEVVASFNKLADVKLTFGSAARLYSGVSMLTTWREAEKDDEFLAWQFPEPIRIIMSDMKSYAHIELAAIVAKKSSKYSTAIYKWLALEAAKRKWIAGGDNRFCVPITPDELADLVDFVRDEKGSYNIGKLSAVVSAHENDYDSVRRFKASGKPIHAKRRGRPVEVYEFTVELQAPSPQHIKPNYRPSNLRELGVGGIDDPRFMVQSDMWVRAQRAFSDANPTYLHANYWKLWLTALSEAVDSKPLTSAWDKRMYRGASLLDQIETEGADKAAWGLIVEEVSSPDLIDFLRADVSRGTKVIGLAECDRRERVGWKADKKRAAINSYYDRHRSSSIPEEYQTEATVVYKPEEANAFDPVTYFDFEPAPEPVAMSFDTCSEICLRFKPVHIDFLEAKAFSLIKSGETGGRKVTVVSTYHDPDTAGTDTWEQEIDVDFEEWCQLLTNLQPHLDGPEVYQ
ncbi:hypothetical protein HJA87_31130 [Rhizobium bangladeshense]|uniref:RepB family plasmid replication initiator protein n=1 Tax=Rhizobium bangladeshense TaxID=1138189 RepID=A0ABS7LS26_9HYPH|nr:hypothetical protein [Rhizobium bangladeshense]MBY3594256.1 hypothetical protein [Rhizobium bangladeshense]